MRDTLLPVTDILDIDEHAFIHELYSGNTNGDVLFEVVGIDTVDQLFLFLLRVFVRGLVANFGDGVTNTVDISKLSEKELSKMSQALARCGIQMHLKAAQSHLSQASQQQIQQLPRSTTPHRSEVFYATDLNVQIEMPLPLSLDTCFLLLHIYSLDTTYRLSFSASQLP